MLWALAALTMLVTNLSALREQRVKRLLAYSSAAQMGYLLMGLVGARYGGLGAAVFFVAIYALMDLGVFGVLAGVSPLGRDLEGLESLHGLARRYPWRAGFLVLCLLSLAGMPPTGGFLGKLFLFTAALRAGHPALALLGVLAAAAAFYYYFKVMAAMYMQPPLEGQPLSEGGQRVELGEGLALAFIAVALLGMGIFPAWLHGLAQAAVATLGG